MNPWECHRCHRINAAWVAHCECNPEAHQKEFDLDDLQKYALKELSEVTRRLKESLGPQRQSGMEAQQQTRDSECVYFCSVCGIDLPSNGSKCVRCNSLHPLVG